MATARAIVVGALAGAALLVTAVPAAAVAEPPDQIVVSGAVVIPRGVDVGEVVVLHGSARIDGVVHGDVIVFDGPIVVRGQVSGDVIGIDGRVVLATGAQINGGVSARGTVAVADGVSVGGGVRQRVAYGWRTPIDVVGRFASWLAVSVSTLLLGLVLVLLAPRALDAVAVVARSAPWPSAGWALALAIGVPASVLLALASLVALPLGLVLLLALALLVFVGYDFTAYAIGRAMRPPPRNRALVFGIGWLILRVVGAVPVLSGFTFALGAAYGLGAAAVATWRARAIAGRHRGGRRAEVPLAPPFGEEAGL